MATLTVEEWALKSIILNTADMKVPDSLKASASDMYGRGIDLHVTQGGEPADMTGMVVHLLWRHRNGNQDATTFEEVDASAGHFRLYYPPAMMYPGEVLARIVIYIGSEKLTGSLNFIIRVEPNPVNEDEALTDESFRTFLEAVEALSSLETIVSANEATRQANENTRVAAENVRVANEETRQANEATRQANENTRVAAETARVSAENTRGENESTRQENEAERQANEETRVSNENTREENEETRADEYVTLRDSLQAAISAAQSAAEAAFAAASLASSVARDVVFPDDSATTIDTLARNVCTSGMYISGRWYVKSSEVSYADGVLTVNGASYLSDTNRMLLPTVLCACTE